MNIDTLVYSDTALAANGTLPGEEEVLCLILIKVQLDATVGSLIYFTAKSLYVFRVSQHPSSGVPKTVTAASGTGHNIGTATSLQRGQIGGK